NSRETEDGSFEIEAEAASAMGSIWLLLLGTRLVGAGGVTERVTGMMRVVTERLREKQRLTYLATRDELTGHLNRNALRTALAEAARFAARGSGPGRAWCRRQCLSVPSGCRPGPRPPRKPCCAPKRRWSGPVPAAATAMPPIRNRRSARRRVCA